MNLRAALPNGKENGNEYNGSYRVWGLGVEKGMETRRIGYIGFWVQGLEFRSGEEDGN